ncbi:alpha/beta hydrolase [Paenarthrobacter sp. A20]|uniref:alpha/beta hydrolase n=1 Tax=Paenarthrobacter sp. A20 TaxID=2817891 RepID=UPI00209E513A|nr:alpha/beta hydrolase [Paenarthrobacter sp. A20]MCP1411864.1 pimeloyl-ACP methyl ester carboxylesterase [Paenarthrobacter sp. A20]
MGIFDTAVEIAFDDGAADALISAADSADQTLRSEGSFLVVATGYAMEDFRGGYATLFARTLAVRADDRGRLAGVLAALAEDVKQAKVKAREEKSRLKELAAWQQRADFREQHFQTFQGVASDPMPAEWPVAAPTISAVFSAGARDRFAGGAGGATSSADPGKLREFVSQSRAFTNIMDAELGRIRNAWSGFTSACSWVNSGSVTFVSGFEQLLTENAADAIWLEQIAAAFETAGSGSMADITLNRALILYAPPGQVGLNDIGALNAAQLKAWLAVPANKDRLQGLLEQPGQDPVVIAKWWAGFGQTVAGGTLEPGEAQLLLIEAIPGVIGNLNGITATARNLANRKRLITEQDRINAELARTPQLLPASQGMSMTNPAWTRLQTQQKALDGITDALRNAGGTKAVLLGFDLTHGSPKAQVSAGNPDTADNVTYAVSGMNITPQSGFNDWATNAANLKLRQSLNDAGESFAVVAWINYEPPTVPTVNSGDAARTGAERFVTDLQAFNAVRESLGNRTPETLHVLAHSYGTTVTSNALAAAALNVASFTMLGSAGIEKEIRNTGDLHVPGGHVYASEASGDGLADLGRFQRQDPRLESFGAKVFSSEEATIDGTQYQGTTEHNTLVHRTASDGYGYLDKETTALYEAALTTTGNGDRILPNGRPVSPPLGFAGR